MNIQELFSLKGKTAIVTGGGRGLGQQIATAYAEAGANIVICSRNLDACKQFTEALQEKGVRAIACKYDVSNPEEIQHVVDGTLKEFGRIDILVNNSGT